MPDWLALIWWHICFKPIPEWSTSRVVLVISGDFYHVPWFLAILALQFLPDGAVSHKVVP